MGTRRAVLLVVLMALLPQLTHPAAVSGIVWDAVGPSPIVGAAVEINTTPMQREITGADGSYSFQLWPGEYELAVKRVNRDHELEQEASQKITVSKEGNYTLDILVFFSDISVPDFGNDSEFEVPSIPEQAKMETGKGDLATPLGVLALALIVIASFLYIMKKQGENEKEKEKKGDAPLQPAVPAQETRRKKEKLPGDLREIVRIMKRNEGRMTQKDLRKEIPLSEAKVSLMITDLESRGVIRRIKQGRGNILVLNEGA
jgi:uncharacterized membrane protein